MTLPEMNFVEWILFGIMLTFMLGGAILVASFFWSIFRWWWGFTCAFAEWVQWKNMLREGKRAQKRWDDARIANRTRHR